MTFTMGDAQELGLPDASFDVVTCTLAKHHIPARQRAAALREMYRVTKPGGHLPAADFDPSRRLLSLHPGGGRMRRAAATVGPLEELTAAAGYPVEATCRCCAPSWPRGQTTRGHEAVAVSGEARAA
jgi:ubiquinone/menaquinone biosynthesis C-methylase UbiE